jgi:hypothetical protein
MSSIDEDKRKLLANIVSMLVDIEKGDLSILEIAKKYREEQLPILLLDQINRVIDAAEQLANQSVVIK